MEDVKRVLNKMLSKPFALKIVDVSNTADVKIQKDMNKVFENKFGFEIFK